MMNDWIGGMNHERSQNSDKVRRVRREHHLSLVITGVLLVALGCAYGPQARPASATERITKGPCLLRVGRDRAAVMWETDVGGPWTVNCGREGRPEGRYDSRPVERLGKAYVHKLWIDGLEPGRRYRYRLVGPHVRSDTYEFSTIPAQTDEVRFVVYGDTRTNVSVHRRLVEQIMKHDPAFVVNVGDLVSRGDEYAQWEPQFFQPMKGLIEKVPVYITKGNHEGRNGTYEKLLLPPGEGNAVGFDYGPLHFFCADNVSKQADANGLVLSIARDARASGAPWKFVSYHVPNVNFGGHWSNWRQDEALPAFAEVGIDFVITGHSHQYERFRPVQPAAPGHPVTYITSGGGGAPLYPIEPTAYHAYAKPVYQFCLFHIKGETLTMDTIDADGQVIDHIQVTKRNGRPDPQYAQTAAPMGGIQLHRRLYESLGVALSDKPKKGRAFTMSVDLTVPKLPSDARLTFELRGDPASYELPPAQTMMVARTAGAIHVELTATPTSAIRLKSTGWNKPALVEPALSLECRYELGDIKEIVRRPVMVLNR